MPAGAHDCMTILCWFRQPQMSNLYVTVYQPAAAACPGTVMSIYIYIGL